MSAQNPCPICGNALFTPGPNGRLTSEGLPPNCTRCRSLERHRILYNVWHILRNLFPLQTYTCLQIAEDPSIRPAWFKGHYLSVYGGVNSMDIQQIPLPDSSVDIVICNHVLEHVADDEKALREMLRILKLNGFLQLTMPSPSSSEHTKDWGHPDPQCHGHYRIYGRDVMDLFARAASGMYFLCIAEKDPCTGVDDVVFLVSHAPVTRPLTSAFPRAHFQRLETGILFPARELGL